MTINKALVISKNDEDLQMNYEQRPLPTLSEDQVLVKIAYSDINYKDYLATKPKTGVVKSYPHIGGVDFSGTVIDSLSTTFEAGDSVIGTGYEIGTKQDGAYQQYYVIAANQLVKLPENLSLKEAMQFGTAGLTAASAISQLLNHVPAVNHHDEILITGVTGGVGGFVLTMLAQLGYQNLTVLTRDLSKSDYLKKMGAHQIIATDTLMQDAPRALMHQKYHAVIDSIGGKLVAQVLPQMQQFGCVIACGNANSYELNTTIYPFILRGVSLIGIDSVYLSQNDRQNLWQLLSQSLLPKKWPLMTTIDFDELKTTLENYADKKPGRYLIKY